jgi:hypothetical protein
MNTRIKHIVQAILAGILVLGVVLAASPQLASAAPASAKQPEFKFTITVIKGTITIFLPSNAKKGNYNVRARDGEAAIRGFTNIGRLSIDKNFEVTPKFRLPAALKDKFYVQVCLKNRSTDRLSCATAVNIR